MELTTTIQELTIVQVCQSESLWEWEGSARGMMSVGAKDVGGEEGEKMVEVVTNLIKVWENNQKQLDYS